MFCNQCEQTAKGVACTSLGVCGKTTEVANIQDELVWLLRHLAAQVIEAEQKDIDLGDTCDFMYNSLFSTLTNVNFDPAALRALQEQTLARISALGGDVPADPAAYWAAHPEAILRPDSFNADTNVTSAMQILLFGLKGVAAYADHAARLGQKDHDVCRFICKGLVAGTQWDKEVRDLEGWLGLAMECGMVNLRAMELLEKGNTETFGHPVPTPVSLGQRKGKAILVSGHDLSDLLALLKQTEGTGIQVYTHGEMLPAHGYPQLKAYPHLAGHYGTAWQNQQKELPAFPGPVLFTTNCIQNPRDYDDKVFTTGNVGWPGCTHCSGQDFSAVIAKAQEMDGFVEDKPGQEVLTGFGRKTMLEAAPLVLDAVSKGQLRHIFLVGGCDGAKNGRSYFRDFVTETPQDTLILTLACGKFRFFEKNLGQIGELPRLLDMGQCNDAYAAVQVALALAEALKCTVNDLPLTLVLSWYEQKAVSILLTLLALGVKNIWLGPSLPAFISPDIFQVLVDRWQIHPIRSVQFDMVTMMS